MKESPLLEKDSGCVERQTDRLAGADGIPWTRISVGSNEMPDAIHHQINSQSLRYRYRKLKVQPLTLPL
jgi:hypothetical protein